MYSHDFGSFGSMDGAEWLVWHMSVFINVYLGIHRVVIMFVVWCGVRVFFKFSWSK